MHFKKWGLFKKHLPFSCLSKEIWSNSNFKVSILFKFSVIFYFSLALKVLLNINSKIIVKINLDFLIKNYRTSLLPVW